MTIYEKNGDCPSSLKIWHSSHQNCSLDKDEMPFEDDPVMEGGDIIEVEYCMSKLVDIMALGQRI